MTVYSAKSRTPDQNYFASVVHVKSGASSWEHVRTNLGRKVAYAMIARHIGPDCKIAHFRDEATMDAYDREGLASGSDGVLRENIWAGHSSSGESYATAGL